MRIGGRSGARPVDAAQPKRANRLTRTPAFGVAVIAPLVLAGAVAGSPSPRSAREEPYPVGACRHHTGGRSVTHRPRPLRSGRHRDRPRPDGIPHRFGHHVGTPTTDDREYPWCTGHSDDCPVRLPQCRTEDGRRGPGLWRQLEPASRDRAHRVGPRGRRRRRRARYRGRPDLRSRAGWHAARQRGHPFQQRRQSGHLCPRDGADAVPARHLGALRLRRQGRWDR